MRSGFVNFHDSLDPLLEPIGVVQAHPSNPRNGDIDAIAKSIKVNGFVAPIIVQRSTGHIIAGNHRYYALLQLNSEIVPVVWVDMDDLSAKNYMLDDNRTSDLGNYDNANLVAVLEELAEAGRLEDSAYTPYDLEVLKHLVDMPMDDTSDFGSWPTLTFTVPPHVKKAFLGMTSETPDDREKFELLMRLAGWDGYQ